MRRVTNLCRSPRILQHSLLAQGEIRFAAAGNSHRLRLIFRALMPYDQVVAAIGHIFDFVVAAVVGLGKIRSWADNDVSAHFWMNIAKQRYHASFIEAKGTFFAL